MRCFSHDSKKGNKIKAINSSVICIELNLGFSSGALVEVLVLVQVQVQVSGVCQEFESAALQSTALMLCV